MLVGVPEEKSLGCCSSSPLVQQPEFALGVCKDAGYTNTITSLHSSDREAQTSGINHTVSRQGDNLEDCLPWACALASTTLSSFYFYFQD